MSESNITITIEPDGEYCGDCRFLGNKFGRLYWCIAFVNVGSWLRRDKFKRGDRDKFKRCDKCIRQAVPIEEQEEQ